MDDLPIKGLPGVSIYLSSKLAAQGVYYVADLDRVDDIALLKVPGFGSRCWKELQILRRCVEKVRSQ